MSPCVVAFTYRRWLEAEQHRDRLRVRAALLGELLRPGLGRYIDVRNEREYECARDRFNATMRAEVRSLATRVAAEQAWPPMPE